MVIAALLGIAPAVAQTRTSDHIAPTANTSIPVYDTAWHMFSRATTEQADEYFAELSSRGFTGAWAMVLGHAPTTYNHTYNGGGLIGEYTDEGEIELSDGYIDHVNEIMDRAHDHGMQMGLVVIWQNLYLPGGQSDSHVPASDLVRGRLTTDNAAAYGRHMVDAFGSHPALNSWVFGGDAGSNNTAANIEVWEIMADAIRGQGSTTDIGIHLPPFQFDSLLYQDVDFLDFAAPEIGHNKTPAQGQFEMEEAVAAYDIPVWMGEARYFNSDFAWVNPENRNPGLEEMVEDAVASKNAGVQGYLYGDAGRFTWCNVFGDSTPCDRDNIADSFGEAEDAVIAIFASDEPAPATTTTTIAPTTTTTTTTTVPPAAPTPVVTHECDGARATIVGTAGDDVLRGTSGDDVIVALAGDDVVHGGGGNDIICGNGGNDTLSGGLGFDIIHGGAGGDRLYANDEDERIDTDGAELYGGAGRDLLLGSNLADVLKGQRGRDELRGYSGKDVLRGGKGDDHLVGGNGADDIDGGKGADDSRGAKGADHITAASGDSIRGGAGNDVCVDQHLAVSVASCESS